MKYRRFLTYLGDKETSGIIRVIIPYLLINNYREVLANFDFTMTNIDFYFEGLNVLQVQRSVTSQQYEVIKYIKQNIAPKYGFKIFYDIDDLVTDIPKFSQIKEYYDQNQDNIKRILSTVDCIICSTARLAKNLSKYNKTKVIQNRLFRPLWPLEERESFFETNTKPKILWAGGHTHFSKSEDEEHDFDKEIMKFIEKTTDKYEWIFCGHRPIELQDPKITFYPWNTNYFEYPEMLRDIDPDIGIALLQDNEFNKCKSNLKGLEYVAMGIPGIYSKITPYEFMSCKVSSTEQFIEKVEKMTTDYEYYKKIRDKDLNSVGDKLYWDDAYVKSYLSTYLKYA